MGCFFSVFLPNKTHWVLGAMCPAGCLNAVCSCPHVLYTVTADTRSLIQINAHIKLMITKCL